MVGPVKCTYLDCQETFQTEKEMKLHKKLDERHDYCRRCDYDAEDWDDLLAHKVDAMAPYVVGDRRYDKVKEPKHIVCEFCGEEFKSFGGRDRHRTQQHQADQYIICRASQPVADCNGNWTIGTCGKLFLRPSALIHHYESEDCQFVTARRFDKLCNQRYIVQQILQDHMQFLDHINSSRAMKSHTMPCDDEDYDGDSDSVDDVDHTSTGRTTYSGGIKLDMTPCTTLPRLDLLSVDSDEQTINAQSLKPKPGLNVMDMKLPMTGTLDAKPRVGTDTPSCGPSSHITSSSMASAGPWLREKSLCEFVKSDTTDSKAVLDATAYTRKQDMVSSLWHSGFWDPENHSEFNIDFFFSDLIQKYACPFPNCDAVYLLQHDMESHLEKGHKLHNKHCLSCFKTFRSVAAIVAHFEASERGARKCIVAKRTDYKNLLYNVTGGFLSGKHVHDDEVAGIKAKYVKSGGQKVLKLVKVDELSGAPSVPSQRTLNDRAEEAELPKGSAKASRGVMKFRYDARIPEGSDKNERYG